MPNETYGNTGDWYLAEDMPRFVMPEQFYTASEALERALEKKKLTWFERVEAHIKGADERVTKDEVRRYFDEVKKSRHLTKRERRYLHKPKTHRRLKTSGVDVSDLVPKKKHNL